MLWRDLNYVMQASMSFSIEFIVLKRKRLNKGKGVVSEGWKEILKGIFSTLKTVVGHLSQNILQVQMLFCTIISSSENGS